MHTWTDGTYLAHHGILGQKWGIRRFQNKDGTYTEAGKKRRNKDGTLTAFGKAELDRELAETKKTVNASSLTEKSDRLNALANEISDDYDSLYKRLNTNKKFKSDCLAYIDEQKKLGLADDDTLDMDVYEAVDAVLPKYIPESLINKLNLMDQYSDDYWNELRSYADDLIAKYKDAKIRNTSSYYDTAEFYIRNFKWDDNQSWNAYLGRHFDDYWVNDLDSKQDLYASILD